MVSIESKNNYKHEIHQRLCQWVALRPSKWACRCLESLFLSPSLVHFLPVYIRRDCQPALFQMARNSNKGDQKAPWNWGTCYPRRRPNRHCKSSSCTAHSSWFECRSVVGLQAVPTDRLTQRRPLWNRAEKHKNEVIGIGLKPGPLEQYYYAFFKEGHFACARNDFLGEWAYVSSAFQVCLWLDQLEPGPIINGHWKRAIVIWQPIPDFSSIYLGLPLLRPH